MIKFETLGELEHLLSFGKREETFILPLNPDGRLGLPIAYDSSSRSYMQVDRHGAEGYLFSTIEALPEKGWVIEADSYILGDEEPNRKRKWFNINTVGVSQSELGPKSAKLEEFIRKFSKDGLGEFSIDDRNIVKAIQIAVEVEIRITIGWLDPKVPVCLWLLEK